MHTAALNEVVKYLAIFEGGGKSSPITWMYLDERALVSTGIGILLDPWEPNKYKVKFYRKQPDGTAGDDAATDIEVKQEFDMVKSKSEAAATGLKPLREFTHYKAFEPITNLRIKGTASEESALSMAKANDRAVRQLIGPDYDTWPADVQIAIVQMGYAGGLNARLKNGLLPLLKARDWYSARSHTYLTNAKSGTDGYLKHNKAIDTLMMNGWIIDKCKELGSNMVNPAPKDNTVFYGLTNRLWVSRWNKDTVTPEIRTDDIITGGDITKWLNDWFIRTLRSKANKN